MFDVTKLKAEDLELVLKASELIKATKEKDEPKVEEPKQIEVEVRDISASEFTDAIRLNLPKYQNAINDVEVEVLSITGFGYEDIDDATVKLVDTLCKAVWNLKLYIKNPIKYCKTNTKTPYASALERIDKLCSCIIDVVNSADMGYDVVQQAEPLTANEDIMEWDCPEDSTLIFGESLTENLEWNDKAKKEIEAAVSKAITVLDNSSFVVGTPWKTRFDIMANQIAVYLGLTSLNNMGLVSNAAASLSQSICNAWDYNTSVQIMMVTMIADRMEDEFNLLLRKEDEDFAYSTYGKDDFIEKEDCEVEDLAIDIPKNANFFSDMYEAEESETKVEEGRDDDVTFPDAEDSDEYGNDEVPTEVGTTDEVDTTTEALPVENKPAETEVIPSEKVSVEPTSDRGTGVEKTDDNEAVLAALKAYVRTVYRVLQTQNVGDFQDIACVNTMNAYVKTEDLANIKNQYPAFAESFNKIGRLANSGGKIPDSYDALVKSIVY